MLKKQVELPSMVGGLGIAFDVFCVTLLFLASQSLGFELLALPSVASFFD